MSFKSLLLLTAVLATGFPPLASATGAHHDIAIAGVTLGMPKDAVKERLGPPTAIRAWDPNIEVWKYVDHLTIGFVMHNGRRYRRYTQFIRTESPRDRLPTGLRVGSRYADVKTATKRYHGSCFRYTGSSRHFPPGQLCTFMEDRSAPCLDALTFYFTKARGRAKYIELAVGTGEGCGPERVQALGDEGLVSVMEPRRQ